MIVENAIHQQYIVSAFFGCFDVAVLFLGIIGIKVNQLFVFVGLRIFNLFFIFFKSKILAVGVFEQAEFFGAFIKFLVRNHTIFNKDFDIVPFFLKIFTVGFEDFFQLIGNFFSDMARYFFNIGVALEITSRNIQRNVG